MKIFLGIDDCSNHLFALSRGLRASGHEPTVFIRSRDEFFSEYYDPTEVRPYSYFAAHISGDYKRKDSGEIFFDPSLKTLDFLDQFDCYIFHYADTLLPCHLDLPILKRLGKKIIWLFAGSEIRWWQSYALKYSRYHDRDFIRFRSEISHREPWSHEEMIANYWKLHESLNIKLNRVRMAELYADKILSRPDMDDLQLRPYDLTHLAIDSINSPCVDSCIDSFRKTKKLRVLHAPSNRRHKGSLQFEEVLGSCPLLQDKIVFSTVSGISHDELICEMQNCHIVYDQSGFWGYISLEAMMSGSIAVTGQSDDKYYQLSSRSRPIIDCRVNDLPTLLLDIFNNRGIYTEYISMGIDYVNSSCNEAFCSSRLLSEDYVPIHPTLKDTGIILSADNPIDLPVNSFNMEITQKVIDRYSSAIDSRALEYAKMINLVHN